MDDRQKPNYAIEASPWIFRDFSLDVPDVNSSFFPVNLDTGKSSIWQDDGANLAF